MLRYILKEVTIHTVEGGDNMIYEREWSNPDYVFLSYEVDGLNWHLHFHETFEICYIISGSIKIVIDKTSYILEKGDGAIIFPRQLHSYESDNVSKMRIITFMPTLVPEFSEKYRNMLPVQNSISTIKKYEDRFSPKNIIEKKGLLYSILGDLISQTEFKNAAYSDESQLLIKVLKFVENNYMGDCSLTTVAERLSYSYSYLSRIFKKMMRMSYKEYINQYRINRAIYMLSNSKNMQIQEIASKCGYDSLCSFNRNFKELTGTTPSKMMRMNIAHRQL